MMILFVHFFQQQQHCFADHHHLHHACLRKNFTEKTKKNQKSVVVFKIFFSIFYPNRVKTLMFTCFEITFTNNNNNNNSSWIPKQNKKKTEDKNPSIKQSFLLFSFKKKFPTKKNIEKNKVS